MMNRSRKLTVGFWGTICVVLIFVGVTVISRRVSFHTAEDTMSPYSGASEYAFTKFRLLGYIGGKGPTWLFYYDSPRAFDAAPFTVEVDFWGRLRTVHTQKAGLWDRDGKKWIMTPE